MKKIITIAAAAFFCIGMAGQEFNRIPLFSKWISNNEVAFSYDGSFTDSLGFRVIASKGKVVEGVNSPHKFSDFPVKPQGAVNMTYSPDSTKIAFTRQNDLYYVDIASGVETRVTYDGTDVILNGYASWVYYEEIFGRPSRYKAFWWSPDSKKIAFYRFDNSKVPMFPIYSPMGQSGRLNQTRYPKAGQTNPLVRIGMYDLEQSLVVWAHFGKDSEQYFGTPFWGPDSRELFVSREPRVQNTLDLYAVNAGTGDKRPVYHEEYKTWLDWIDGVVFTESGLYMARDFETGWQQIYYLSYDGKTLKRLTDGRNWNVSILRVDEKKGDVYFLATRDELAKRALYKVDGKGTVTALTDPCLNASNVKFSPDGKYFVATLSNLATPDRIWLYKTSNPAKGACLVADMKGKDYDASRYALPQMIYLTCEDGQIIPATVTYPKNFTEKGKYPVHFEIYGGPGTPYVQDRWRTPSPFNQWWSDNGIISVVADSRVSGHTGREGLDLDWENLTAAPVEDFCAWASYFQSLPYVIPDKIGVEGFSFGGTMTALLIMNHSDKFQYGIAGGGVYDWMLYDSHYTERFMNTPHNNREGYKAASVIGSVSNYPVDWSEPETAVAPVMLKLTHGTGDDNVHFQNTLQLIDALQKEGKKFELMIYPDGMHGYRGAQARHSNEADHAFWLKYLKSPALDTPSRDVIANPTDVPVRDMSPKGVYPGNQN